MRNLKNAIAVVVVLIVGVRVGIVRAQPVQWPVSAGGNGHYYELEPGGGQDSWADQNSTCMLRTFAGLNGHLATITSEAESQWIVENIFVPHLPHQSVVYLGGWNDGFRDSPGSCQGGQGQLGDWRWITGEPWGHEPWATGEPSVGPGGCTREFVLSYMYNWMTDNGVRNGFNNLEWVYGAAGLWRLVEYDELAVTDGPTSDPPVAVEQRSWGALKAQYR